MKKIRIDKNNARGRKDVYLSCVILIGTLLFISFILNVKQASAYEWTKNFTTSKMEGVISKDEKSCWIKNIEQSMIKKNVLRSHRK